MHDRAAFRVAVRRALVFLGFVLLLLPSGLAAQDRLDVLIVNGQSNHDWAASTASARTTLLNTGRFNVDVSTSPPAGSPPSAWAGWQPQFANYDVVVSVYKGEMWPAQVRADFEAYIAGGGGAVIFHAPLAAFFPPHLNPGEVEWTGYSDMLGLGWRPSVLGTRVVIDDATGDPIFLPAPLGGSSNHGAQHSFVVKSRRPAHPIMSGLPAEWMHGKDELYHAMRGPAQNIEVLASAFSDSATGGTGLHEPMLWTVAHGAGRIVTTPMGHRWFGGPGAPGTTEENGPFALSCVGFQTLLARSAEWAATGQVTIPAPAAFPTALAPSMVDPQRGVWLNLRFRINGADPPLDAHIIPAGPLNLTLDVSPGLFTDPLDFYFGVLYRGQLYWVTPAGLAAAPVPLTHVVPVPLENAGVLTTALAAGDSITFVAAFARGSTMLSYEVLTAVASGS